MHLIFERLKGATFQTELLVMTLLGLANCTLNWRPFDWPIQAEKIREAPMTSKYSESIKSVLRWVTIARMIINHMYFASYLGNLYSVFTWCRPKLLLPWIIVSGFKNFFLEVIVFLVVALLYVEGNFPSTLFVEFIVERAITIVTASYYWCGIKKLYIQLGEVQRLKFTRRNSAEHLKTDDWRFDDVFTTLDNSKKLSIQSSFEVDGYRKLYRLTKSLTTLIAMDSRISVEFGDDTVLSILEDTTLAPREKALRILGLNEDDVDGIRCALGKTNPHNKMNLSREKIKSKDEGLSNVESRKAIEISATQTPLNDSSNDENTSQVGSASYPRNNLSRCTCIKSNMRLMNRNGPKNIEIYPGEIHEEVEAEKYKEDDRQDLRQTLILPDASSEKYLRNIFKTFGPSVFWSIDFPRPGLRKEDSDFKNLETAIFPSFVTPTNKPSGVLSGQQKRNQDNILLRNADLETKNNYVMRGESVELNFFYVPGDENFMEIHVQTDFSDDGEEWLMDKDVADDEYCSMTSRISRSTQTRVSGFGNENSKNSKRTNRAFIEHSSTKQSLSGPRPAVIPTNTKKISFSEMIKFEKIIKRTEKMEEREAREMRALRAYNKVTLLEDKREMDLKKGNSEFRNRTGFLASFSTNNSVNVFTKNIRELMKLKPNRRFANEKLESKFDETAKRQSRRSRPHVNTSKLSTLNLGLDALENSICLTFSSENKNRSRPENSKKYINGDSPKLKKNETTELSKNSEPLRIFVEENAVSSSSTTRIIEGFQTCRDLERSCRVEDIRLTDAHIQREVDCDVKVYHENRLKQVISETMLSSVESFDIGQANYPYIDRFNNSFGREEVLSVNDAISNIDWKFNDRNLYLRELAQQENVTMTNCENVLYDIIDDTDTITLLQSTFASNPDNTERGFNFGPGAPEIYTVSNFFDDVFEEIIKTARLRSNLHCLTVESNNELDYGDAYLLELEITTSSTHHNIDQDELINSNSDSKKLINEKIETLESVPSKFVEMCWNGHSSEAIDEAIEMNNNLPFLITDSVYKTNEDELYRDARKWKKHRDTNKNIADLLGEKEISYIEYWAKQLKDLVTRDRRNDFEMTKEIRHLTRLPGFCVIKMLVDFFRDLVGVSRSTMTSRMYLGEFEASNSPSSGISEEIISGQYNALSSTSRGSINDDRSMFPLRKDEFNFGELKNNNCVKKGSTSNPEIELIGDNNRKDVVTDREINSEQTIKQEEISFSAELDRIKKFSIFGGTWIIRDVTRQALENQGISRENCEGPFVNNYASDIFDNFYSAGPINSKCSANVGSIGETSTFEEFTEHTSISTSSIESANRNITGAPQSKDKNSPK